MKYSNPDELIFRDYCFVDDITNEDYIVTVVGLRSELKSFDKMLIEFGFVYEEDLNHDS